MQLASPTGTTSDGAVPDLRDVVGAAAAQTVTRWPDTAATELAMLTDLTPAGWAARANPLSASVILGVAESGLQAVAVDFSSGQHLLWFGDEHTGRSRALSRVMHAVDERLPPAHLYLVDYRGTLYSNVHGLSSLHTALTPDETEPLVDQLAEELRRRQGIVAERLRSRTAERQPLAFAPVILVVDDLELVAAGKPRAFDRLVPFAPYPRELQFSVIINQASAATPGRQDTLLRKVQELDAWVLNFGVRPRPEAMLTRGRPQVLPPGQALLYRADRPQSLMQLLPPEPPDSTDSSPLQGRPVSTSMILPAERTI